MTGTLGVLRAGAEQGVVNVPDLIERLTNTTFYMNEALLKSVFAPWLEPWPEADSRSAATVTTTGYAYCAALGISPPRIDDAKASPDANYYSLLIIALLERGGPMTLAEAAARFAAAGVTSSVNEALAALKRCKPARTPIYRDGDSYALDPHDDEVDFWLFRLGLRPPRIAPLRVAPNAIGPLPSADQPLTVAAQDEAWREGVPISWSA